MSMLQVAAISAAFLCVAPAFGQEPAATVRVTVTAPSGRPTLMSYLGSRQLPDTVEALIARLNEPGVCEKEAWPVPDPKKPCAIIVYYLVDRDETMRTPKLVIRAIQHVSHPADPLATALRISDLDGRMKYYSDGRLDEPLRPMRVENSCTRTWNTSLVPPEKVKKCKRVNASYIPIGILGYIENEEQQILTGRAKELFFSLALSPDDTSTTGF